MDQLFKRGTFLTGAAAAFAGIGIVRSPARAAQYQYKFACNTTIDHPLTVRARQMWDAVKAETQGRLDVTLFPNSQLGGDTAMLAQLRSGAIQFLTLSGGILNTVVPVAGIQGVPFAFKTSPQVQAAFDGALGEYVRKEIASAGMYAFPNILENGFRQITSSTHPIRTVDDLNGFKIRTPSGRLWVDLFKTLGAQVSPLNLSEVYSGLQTHIIDGQENPYIVISFDRFAEVQKYLSVTNHMWDGYWLLANDDAWKNLPPDMKAVVSKHAVV